VPPEPITRLTSNILPIDRPNIDTDQIVPARFLTVTERGGLAKACFHDWRFDAQGRPTDHSLNRLPIAEHAILVAGENFGCGSSREHAPWALKDLGFRAVVTAKAADIFKSNALKNGLIVAEIDAAAVAALMAAGPKTQAVIDLDALSLRWHEGEARFTMDPFARRCLMDGVDPLGYILARAEAIDRYEAEHAA